MSQKMSRTSLAIKHLFTNNREFMSWSTFSAKWIWIDQISVQTNQDNKWSTACNRGHRFCSQPTGGPHIRQCSCVHSDFSMKFRTNVEYGSIYFYHNLTLRPARFHLSWVIPNQLSLERVVPVVFVGDQVDNGESALNKFELKLFDK